MFGRFRKSVRNKRMKHWRKRNRSRNEKESNGKKERYR